MRGPERDVEGGQVRDRGRLRQEPLGERVDQDEHTDHEVKGPQGGERGDDRRVRGALDRALREDDLHRVAAPRGEDPVETGADEERARDANLGHPLARVGGAEHVRPRVGACELQRQR